MTLVDLVKTNPFKTAGALASSLTAILGAVWALDSHYASAADLQSVQKNFSQQMQQIRADQLDDQVFMLQLKKNQQNGTLNPVDAAMLERYIRQLQSIQADQERAQREVKK